MVLRPPLRAGTLALLAAAVLVGAGLRLAWPWDLEWKADEQWMYARATTAGAAAFPWQGMPSGVDTPNPGMSVWVFSALVRSLGIGSPVALAQAVMALNALALVLLALFAWTREGPERESFLWATALAAVNPGAVQLQRKIWAQSVLPIVSLAALAAFWNRRRPWGAFAWGALGACLGQIHMSGFFFAGALAGWTWLSERRAAPDARTRWKAWLVGSALAAWPLAPWLAGLLGRAGQRPHLRWWEPLTLGFWQCWAVDVTGLQVMYSLGWEPFLAWLREPVLPFAPPWTVAALFGLVLASESAAVVGAVAALLLRGGLSAQVRQSLADGSHGAVLQNVALLGFGLFLTASFAHVWPHYLIVAFPLTGLWLARLALGRPRGRALLGTVVAAHALLSASFLLRIHRNGGSPGGDYGVAYRAQAR